MKALRVAQQLAIHANVCGPGCIGMSIPRAGDQLRSLATSASQIENKQDLSPSEGIKYDPIDLEFDRFNGSAALFEERQEVEPLGRPVDIEVELDRDDPEAVDMEALYSELSEEELLESVDLDDEFDLMHDVVVEPGTMSGNVIPLTGDKAGPEDVGKYSGTNVGKERVS